MKVFRNSYLTVIEPRGRTRKNAFPAVPEKSAPEELNRYKDIARYITIINGTN